jgi:hypothetical protein
MNCADPVQQDPSKIFRSGLWKQWIHWSIPGPKAYEAIQRVVAEVNGARAGSGLPLLVPNPTYEIVASVFDERNARGANGSSALPTTINQEAFLAVFVDDTAGGFNVLFLTDPLRSNPLLAAKGVPGVTSKVERGIALESKDGEDFIETEWEATSPAGDRISLSAAYGSAAVYFHGVSPASRVDYANCNLKYSSSLVYRSAPGKTFSLFAREEANYVDLSAKDVKVRLRVSHHDRDVHAIFNDPLNVPEVLIGLDRDVRIQVK